LSMVVRAASGVTGTGGCADGSRAKSSFDVYGRVKHVLIVWFLSKSQRFTWVDVGCD